MFFSNIKPMTDEEILKHAPGVFGREKFEGRKDKYNLFNTYDVIQGMREAGFEVSAAYQGTQRAESGAPRNTRAHVVRFRSAGSFGLNLDDTIPEVVLVNSHDGSTQFDLSAGLYRMACSNGLMVAVTGTFEGAKLRHMGHTMDEVVAASERVAGRTAELMERVNEMKALNLNSRTIRDFLKDAIDLKFGQERAKKMAIEHPEALLQARRAEDVGNDLWSVYNRVQENMLKGGITLNQRALRNITNVNEGIRLNRGLWEIADNFRVQYGAVAA